MLKILFHFYNLLLIILYIYPGSILGFLVYKDLSRQPQITSDFFSISSNHLYVFIILSLLGLLSNKKNLLLFFYLISISIFLEVCHLIIPNRSFQFSDLFGNILGVIIPFIINNLYKFRKKNEHIRR